MLSPHPPTYPKICRSLRLSTPDSCALFQGKSVSAVTSSALCPLPPVFSHSVAIRPAFSVSSNHPDPEALRLEKSYAVSSHPRSYDLIRLSDRLLPTSYASYTEGLWHSRIVPACLPDSPFFICLSLTGCHHPYAGKCIRCPRLFLPWYHWPSLSLDSLGTSILNPLQSASCGRVLRRCNVRFMLRPPVLLSPCADLNLPLNWEGPTSFLLPSFLRTRHLLLSRI